MTSTRPSPTADAPLAGLRGWSVRSALAPAPFSRSVLAGIAAVVLIETVDLATGVSLVVGALLVLAPLVVALTGRWGDTLVVALAAVAAPLFGALVSDEMSARGLAIPLILAIAGGLVAIAVAMAQAGAAVALGRFRLLVGVA